MTVSELLAKPWTELVAAATQAIANKDLNLLDTLDLAFHKLFLDDLWAPGAGDWGKFVDGLLEVTDSPEARACPQAEAVQKRLLAWEHLESLAEGLRRREDSAGAARRCVESRERAPDIVRLAAAAGPSGVAFRELGERLGMQDSNLSAQLRQLEAYDVVCRRKVGRKLWVSLGRAGRAYAESRGWLGNVIAFPADLFEREAAKTNEPLTRARVWAAAGAL